MYYQIRSDLAGFHDTGYAVVDFPPGAVLGKLNAHHQRIIERFKNSSFLEQLSWTPNGEDEVDSGFYTKGTHGERDFKAMAHIKPGAADRLLALKGIEWTTEDKQFFASCDQLREAVRGRVIEFLADLEETRRYAGTFVDALQSAQQNPQPYAVDVLRLLYYWAQGRPNGGGIHPDRSFFTGHLGGDGDGTNHGLYWTDQLDGTGECRFMNVPSGKLAIFPGVKAQILTTAAKRAGASGEVLSALLHGSIAPEGVERKAGVVFLHCNTPKPVRSAKDAYGNIGGYC